MNVSCPECRSVFRVDPAKVPEAGVRARCSVCGGIISIAGSAVPNADFADVPPAPRRTPAMAGAAAPGPGAGSSLWGSVGGESRPAEPPVRVPPAAAPLVPPAAATPSRSASPATPWIPGGRLTTPGAPRATPFVPGRAVGATGDVPASRTAAPAMPPGPAATHPAPTMAASGATPVGTRTPAATASPPVPPPAGAVAPAAPSATTPVPATSPSVQPASTPTAPQTVTRPATPSGAPAVRRPINPFLTQDPNVKARRLARALVSDMVTYHPREREEGLRNGTLRQLFKEEIKKSYEEYVEQMGKEFAESTTHFQDALNDILAGGQRVF